MTYVEIFYKNIETQCSKYYSIDNCIQFGISYFKQNIVRVKFGPSFNVSSFTHDKNFKKMFNQCYNLLNVEFEHDFNIAREQDVDMSFMFVGCTALYSVVFGENFYMSNSSLRNMFYNCTKLNTVFLRKNFVLVNSNIENFCNKNVKFSASTNVKTEVYSNKYNPFVEQITNDVISPYTSTQFDNEEYVPTNDKITEPEPVKLVTNDVISAYTSTQCDNVPTRVVSKYDIPKTSVKQLEIKPIETLKENGYSSAIGDPYITPYYGNLYKIPDIEAVYRFYQSDKIIINGQIEKISMKKINPKVRFINSNKFKSKLNNIEFENMYFITKVCIFENNSAYIYDIENEEFLSDIGNIQVISSHSKIMTLNELYSNEKVSITHIKVHNIELEFYRCKNPQVYTGLKLINCEANATGILMNECDSTSCLVSNIYDTTHVDVNQTKIGTLHMEPFQQICESRVFWM